MAQAQIREKVATGIRLDRYGYEAYVKIGGKQVTKRFHRDTSVRFIESWRQRQISDAKHEEKLPTRLAPVKKSLQGWCYIYAVRVGDFVKIGRALDVAERLRNMQAAQTEELKLLAAVPAHAALEGALHERFDKFRHRGEWFELVPEIGEFIAAMQKGENPVAWLFGDQS